MNKLILSTAFGLLSIASAQAAVIVWDAGTTDVSTAGGFINAGSDANVSVSLNGAAATAVSTGALNVGVATPTINGVTFTATGAGSGPFGTFGSDADVQSVIHFHNAAAAYSLDFSGLKANTEYQIQILGIHDNRTAGGIDLRTTVWNTAGGTASAGLVRGNGESIIGSFTTGAAETTQLITATNTVGVDPGVSGFVLREIVTVPEPSSTALLGLGGLALILRRRK